MKSTSNFKKLTMVTIAIFVTATLITAASAIMSNNAYAERSMRASPSFDGGVESKGESFPSDSPWSCASKIITDSPEGNALGWDPDGEETIFSIDEPCFFEDDSIVLINLKGG